jgi:hypothetical protein
MDRNVDNNGTEEHSEVSDTIAVASRLVGQGGFTAVHVISSDRPSYDDVLRFRRLAGLLDLEFKVDASSVTFRADQQLDILDALEAGSMGARLSHLPHAARPTVLTRLQLGWSLVIHGVSPSLNRLRLQARIWQAELGTMSEGTR